MEATSVIGGDNKKLGMRLFIISDSLTFAALLGGYCYLRTMSDSWPRPFHLSSIAYGLVMTLCLGVSSVTMMRAVRSARQRDGSSMRRWLGATIGGGVAFMVLHGYEWMRLSAEGVKLDVVPSGWGATAQVFSSTFYGITGLHMLHVLSGVILLGVIAFRRRAPTTDVEVGGMYWQFVDAVWLFVFGLLYLPSMS